MAFGLEKPLEDHWKTAKQGNIRKQPLFSGCANLVCEACFESSKWFNAWSLVVFLEGLFGMSQCTCAFLSYFSFTAKAALEHGNMVRHMGRESLSDLKLMNQSSP